MGRAPGCGPEGLGFASLRAHNFFSSYLACTPTPGHDRMWHNEIALDWQTKDPAQFGFFVFTEMFYKHLGISSGSLFSN